ncbi:MAG: hypothetical protein ABGX20_05620 [Bacillus sp. (in: firmicutes)]
MKKHPTIREKELQSKLLSGELLEADIKAAFELAQDTSKPEHIGLYSKLKQAYSKQEEKKALTPDDNVLKLAEDMVKLFQEGNDLDSSLKQFEAIKQAFESRNENQGGNE